MDLIKENHIDAVLIICFFTLFTLLLELFMKSILNNY